MRHLLCSLVAPGRDSMENFLTAAGTCKTAMNCAKAHPRSPFSLTRNLCRKETGLPGARAGFEPVLVPANVCIGILPGGEGKHGRRKCRTRRNSSAPKSAMTFSPSSLPSSSGRRNSWRTFSVVRACTLHVPCSGRLFKKIGEDQHAFIFESSGQVFLPLPAGEGRGEGDRGTIQSTLSDWKSELLIVSPATKQSFQSIHSPF